MTNKLYNEQGQLTDYGKLLFATKFKKPFKEILDEAESENEVRLLGSLVANLVGDLVSQSAATFVRKSNSPLWKMTDEEFEVYLEEKYKDFKNELGMFSMNKEEVERFEPIAKKRVTEAMEETRKYLDQIPPVTYGVRLNYK